jgi:hypothetical protein
MRKPSNVVPWKGSPFAVAVMFLGNGFVMASSYSRMPVAGCVDRALLAVAVLVLLIAILASVARERGEWTRRQRNLPMHGTATMPF